LASGCARRLPGPDECRAFALASQGIEPSTPASALVRARQLNARVEELTRQCLTTPWDYQFLNCLQNGGSQRLCKRGFDARRGALVTD
jgi:hypothetical protein